MLISSLVRIFLFIVQVGLLVILILDEVVIHAVRRIHDVCELVIIALVFCQSYKLVIFIIGLSMRRIKLLILSCVLDIMNVVLFIVLSTTRTCKISFLHENFLGPFYFRKMHLFGIFLSAKSVLLTSAILLGLREPRNQEVGVVYVVDADNHNY